MSAMSRFEFFMPSNRYPEDPEAVIRRNTFMDKQHRRMIDHYKVKAKTEVTNLEEALSRLAFGASDSHLARLTEELVAARAHADRLSAL